MDLMQKWWNETASLTVGNSSISGLLHFNLSDVKKLLALIFGSSTISDFHISH